MIDAAGKGIAPGSAELTAACSAISDNAVVCSKEALAWTLRQIGHPSVGNLVGLAAGIALPSVILVMMFGQTRIFFVMSRDGLLPEAFSKIHPKFKTPYVITIITGVFVALFAAFFPVGALADISNAGTLFAFAMVAIAVMVLRKTDPSRKRPFKTPMVYLVAPIAILYFRFISQQISFDFIVLLLAVLGNNLNAICIQKEIIKNSALIVGATIATAAITAFRQ